MTIQELELFYDKYEVESRLEEELIASKVIADYIADYGNYDLLFEFAQDNINQLFDMYFTLRKRNKSKDLEDIMRKYKFNYNNSIHVAIYNLLEQKKEENNYQIQDPNLFPGIKKITSSQDGKYEKHILDTTKGKIEVYKASEIFTDSKTSCIFKKPLIGQCYSRSYDFIKENRDYKVIVAYLKNFFTEGHFHVFLEKGNEEIVDIASNAYYIAKDFSDKVLKGKRLFELDYDEIEEFDVTLDGNIKQNSIPKLSIITATKALNESKLKKKTIYDSIKIN